MALRVGWLALSLVAAPVLVLEGGESAVVYTTVYLIERCSLLDNLFVFLLLLPSISGVPHERRPRLLFWASSPRSRCAAPSSSGVRL